LDDPLDLVRIYRLGCVHLVDVEEGFGMSAADICDMFAALVMVGVVVSIVWGMPR